MRQHASSSPGQGTVEQGLLKLVRLLREEYRSLEEQHDRARSIERTVRLLCASVGIEVPPKEIEDIELPYPDGLRELEVTLAEAQADGGTLHGRWSGILDED